MFIRFLNNIIMKKNKYLFKTIIYFVLLFIFPFQTGCSHNSSEVVEINQATRELLDIMGLNNCCITYLGEYEGLEYETMDISVTDEEVEQEITDVLESYAEIVEITDRTVVEEGDVVYIDYKSYENGKLANEVSDEYLKVGAGYFNDTIEAALIGKSVGITFDVDVVSDVGTEMVFEITVTSINRFKTYELTEEFVKEKLDAESVEMYIKQVKVNIAEEKRTAYLVEQQEKLLNTVIENSEYILDKNEIAQYSVQVVNNYEDIALITYDSLEEYIEQELGLTEDEFYEQCYIEGENEVKQYITVAAIAKDLNMEISEDELDKLIEENNYKKENVDKDNEMKDSMIFYLLNANVRAYLYDNGQPIK